MNNEEKDKFQKYKEWYSKLNEETGGLILQATAARLLNTPRQNINRMIKIGKIKTYQFEKDHEIYIGINEIEKIIQERLKRAKQTNNAILKHKGTMNIKATVDVTEIMGTLPEEWAEEWIVTQPEISFTEFIEKKKKNWIRKNPDIKIKTNTNENGLEERIGIALIEDDNREMKYSYIRFETKPKQNQ